MLKQAITVVLLTLVLFYFDTSQIFAQDRSGERDTFFLNKKRGLLGKLGNSISRGDPSTELVETANPFLLYAGRSVRLIRILSLGFERNIFDTTNFNNSFGVIIANAFHKNTKEKIIRNNLFFKSGSVINPYLLADNERHLRDLTYIQDARIMVEPVAGSTDLVDVIVITKDVFSIGGNASVNGVDKFQLSLREENAGGSGSKIELSTLYDRFRNPKYGYGTEIIKRNIEGSFIDLKMGYQNYRSAFNSGRPEEIYWYANFEKPLVSVYIPWIGGLDLSLNQTSNAYLKDSLYKSDYQYRFVNLDGWFGYNFGSKKIVTERNSSPLRKLIAMRAFKLKFDLQPGKNQNNYDYNYADISGVLMAFNLFKQKLYRTNFIYGFGRSEDVPEGFSASVTGGFTDKNRKSRSYIGVDLLHTHFNKEGFFNTYTFRLGGFTYKSKWEDVDFLLNLEHFTQLKRLSRNWLNRNFYSLGFTKQINTELNSPLILGSQFGIPYHRNGDIKADFRGTMRGETVFFNMKKYWGFRLALFLFGDLSLLTPVNLSLNKSDLYSAFGAGIRTRNENLVFGTIELRSYFFPRPVPGMKGFKVEISSNLRFKYSNTFIRKPDFIIPN
ncbi:hypothetical protein BH11BAC3_BH11BAC3_32070 [soil metagenome]